MPSQIAATVDVSATIGRSSMLITSGWVRFYNHSIYGLLITLGDGQQFQVPPQTRRTVCVNQASGGFVWEHTLISPVGVGAALSTLMTIETLDLVDVKIPHDLESLGGSQTVGNLTGLNEINFGFGANFDVTIPTDTKTFPLIGPAPNTLSSFVPGATPFFVIRDMILNASQGRLTTRGNHEANYQSVVVTVPSGAVGNVQTFNFPNLTSIKALGFTSFSAGITITSIQIDKNDGIYDGLVIPGAGTITAFGTMDIGLFYGPYGKENYKTPGFNVRLSMNNTAGAKTFTLNVYGAQMELDDIAVFVHYLAPPSNTDVLTLTDYAMLGSTFPFFAKFERVSPIPLPDVTSTNYGSILIESIATSQFYNSVVGIGGAISGSVVYVSGASNP